MKRLVLHVKRLFRKFWFIIFFCFAISLVFGVGILIIMTAISMLFFSDPVDIKGILKNFTEEELEIIFNNKVDENVLDDDYFSILARYQTFLCPKKADRITTWICSDVTDRAYIQKYELKEIPTGFSFETLKQNLLASIDKNSVAVKRAVRSKRSLNFEYNVCNTGENFTIVLTTEDLK